MGKLYKNIHCQLIISVKKPPIAGPKAIDETPTVAVKDKANGNCLGVNNIYIHENIRGISAPPKNPCIILNDTTI